MRGTLILSIILMVSACSHAPKNNHAQMSTSKVKAHLDGYHATLSGVDGAVKSAQKKNAQATAYLDEALSKIDAILK